MSARIWPDVLPGVSAPGYRLQPAEQSIRTDMEVGARRLRRISAANSDSVAVTWVFDDAEMSAFRAWFADAAWSLTGASDDVSDWTLDGVTVTPDVATGPDAALPDKIREDSSTGFHCVEYAPLGVIDGDMVQITVTAASMPRDGIRVGLIGRDGTWRWVDVDIVTGAVLGSDNAASIAVEQRITGWWRIVARFAAGSGLSDPVVRLGALNDAGAAWYAGDGLSGVKLCEINTRVVTGWDLYLRTDAAGKARGAAGGSAWFRVSLAFGGGMRTVEARFLETYEAQPFPGLGWHVRGNLEVRDA